MSPVSGLPSIPVSATTRYCGVLGFPVRHSASPAFQNAGIAALGLDWLYLAFEVPPEDLAGALSGARALRFLGLNLTVPHKLLALEWVDLLDESARAWGAVNTIAFEGRRADGTWLPVGQWPPEPILEIRSRGFNTDADAIAHALEEDLGFHPAGARVLQLGAGGAGRVAALRLAADGVRELWLVNRNRDKAAAVAGDIRRRYPEVRVHLDYPDATVDLVLNATSLGLRASDPVPLDESRFALGRASAVYDMIYRPARTPLLERAEAAGCRTANGIGMLLHQGARALEIWSGQPAPVETMRRALVRHLRQA
ncbi:MAG: shikimate dehydrogenase [Verrucomicrobia bacterium]|nr:shikimate dehydrogenase [Verrucomicrobiota bacterium]